jgi:hypothetical protein
MFGYITPDRPYLFIKDESLYKALYCGLCKSIGAGCGQRARTALTYDMAFMSALVHNIRHEDVKIENKRCAVHLIKRRPIAKVDDLTILLGCINTALAYYKLLDDKQDGDKKGVLRHLYKAGLKRAAKKHAKAVDIIREQMDEQAKVEKGGCDIIDMACEPTANLMKRLSVYVLDTYSTPYTEALFYDIGKWVYLADALDDYDKDVKKGRYNVLYNSYKCPTKAEAVKTNFKELQFIFDSLFGDMRENLSNIPLHFNHDLTDNIIMRGIPLKTRDLLGMCDCKKSKGDRNEQTKS